MAMTSVFDIRKRPKPFYPCPGNFSGEDPAGNTLGFTNYFMTLNGRPYFAVSGELHYSRIPEERWRDALIKMKMSGLSMVSTYVFWIHHEEIKGRFDWSGSKNLRRFAELCRALDFPLILRIGPFAHGECRNGGIPDWLFGAPFDLRSNDAEYLFYVRRFYQEIGEQLSGLMFKDGGPVIAVQLENEYEHAGAPWELNAASSKEWLPAGKDGRAHIEVLRDLAREAGLIAPYYSATAWGGACAPEDIVMPVWGGYAYRPWIFNDPEVKTHPPTGEFLYRDYYSGEGARSDTFHPRYNPEDYPFVCCEMGGGMACFYDYRFRLPMKSIEAMANVKTGSGCNFLGYYMYHGGTNPRGLTLPYLNEHSLPKFSYDYQAPIGEFGQVRESYHRCRISHYFYKDFEALLCPMLPALPLESEKITPEDSSSLRCAVRSRGESGFIFINNFQDHLKLPARDNIVFRIRTKEETMRIPAAGSLSIASEATAILPFNFPLNTLGITLRYASAQLTTALGREDKT